MGGSIGDVKGATVPIQLVDAAGTNVSAPTITLTVSGVTNTVTNVTTPLDGTFTREKKGPNKPFYQFNFRMSCCPKGQQLILLFTVTGGTTGDPVTHEAAFILG